MQHKHGAAETCIHGLVRFGSKEIARTSIQVEELAWVVLSHPPLRTMLRSVGCHFTAKMRFECPAVVTPFLDICQQNKIVMTRIVRVFHLRTYNGNEMLRKYAAFHLYSGLNENFHEASRVVLFSSKSNEITSRIPDGL